MKTRVGTAIFMLFMSVLAVLFGLIVSFFPVKFGLLLTGFVLTAIGVIVVMVMPNRTTIPYRLIMTALALAFAAKFLWPNFAYIPIGALPTKNPQRMLWAIVFAYWLYTIATNSALRHRLVTRLQQSRLVWLCAAFFSWRLLSISTSEQPLFSTYTILVEIFDYLPALLFALTWLDGPDDVAAFTRPIILTTLVICALTVAEVALKQNLFMKFVPTDLANDQFLTMAVEEKLRGGVYRAQASFNHPLLLAQYMVTVFPILIVAFFRDGSRFMRWLAMTAMLALPFVLWASRTRTAVVVAGFVLSSLFLTFAVNRARSVGTNYRRQIGGALAVVAGVALLVALAGAIALLAKGRTAEEAVSSNARVDMVIRAARAVQENPILGFGPGLGAKQAAVYSSRGTGSLDNYWLIMMLDSGMPAMLLFVALLAYGGLHTARYLRTGHVDHDSMLAGMWGTGVIAFGITTLILGTPHNMPLLYFLLGALVAIQYPAAYRQSTIEQNRVSQRAHLLRVDNLSPNMGRIGSRG